MPLVFQAENICKNFTGTDNITILKNVNLKVFANESVAIIGQSGSGKSTLLQICGLLDNANDGIINIDGQECSSISDFSRTLIRRNKLGFVYQFHHLLSEFTVLENLTIPQLLIGTSKKTAIVAAQQYLEKFSLNHKTNSFIDQLSGGEKQRIAIIRSIINKPKLIIADEPTGSLDDANAKIAFSVLNELLISSGAGMIIATHNFELAKMCSRILFLNNGNLTNHV